MNIDIEEIDVVNNERRSRFEMQFEDDVAFASYRLKDKTITFTHTIVPEAYEGMGVGRKLAIYALTWAEDNEMKVIPLCPFISAYIRKHPEYQPLLLGYQE